MILKLSVLSLLLIKAACGQIILPNPATLDLQPDVGVDQGTTRATPSPYYKIKYHDPAICFEYACTEQTCKVPFPNDCRHYIDCIIDSVIPEVSYKAIVMDCAFGTMWDQQEYTCVHVKNATCEFSIDPCSVVKEKSIDHQDDNCRTYWKCSEGKSYPACCPPYMRYDDISHQCVEDPYCAMPCPIMFDSGDKCSLTKDPSVNHNDGNCRTYWNCVDGKSLPACCPEGMRYDVATVKCVPDATCNSACPINFNNLCSDDTVTSYEYNDGNCRTYIHCENRLPLPACCEWGYRYNVQTAQCVQDASCDHEICPDQFIEMKKCAYERFDNEGAYFYLPGHAPLPCSPGTLFNKTSCSCSILKPVVNECKIDMNITFDTTGLVDRAGNAWLESTRSLKLPTRLTPYATFKGGDSAILIRRYDHVALGSTFTKLSFIPDPVTSSRKQILISNCRTMSSNGNVPAGPSFDVRLDPVNDTIVIELRSEVGEAKIKLPYQDGTRNVLYLGYTGQTVKAIVEITDPNTNRTTAFQADASLQGKLIAGIVPLMIGACEYKAQQFADGFEGKINEFLFARCVPEELMPKVMP
ncbi:hypothetical protein CHS0354_012176 [Potamilus streckersoni]|uniref:Chitin-binding type-2 domain-containing protein n=1 Tax=Potamilus streckersoni TaxID=2493646 RepID=A0AAE0VS34_9BIVA|nr:hypothetical protein CHS0354_012176 [Potamilus streckersoni]